MNELLRRLFSFPQTSFSMWLGSLAISALALASPIFVIQTLNRYVTYGVDATLTTLLIGVLLAMTFEAIFRKLRGGVVSAAAALHDLDLEQKFARLMFGRGNTGALQHRDVGSVDVKRATGDLDRVRVLCSGDAMEAALDLPFALIFLFVLVLISPAIGVIAASVMGASVLVHHVSAWLLVQSQRTSKDSQEGRAALTRSLSDATDSMMLFLPKHWLQNRWSEVAKSLLDSLHKSATLKSSSNALGHFLQTGLGVAVIAWGATEVVAGDLQVGDLIGANILAARALGGVNRFSNLLTGLRLAKPAFGFVDRLRRVKSTAGEAGDVPMLPTGPLHLSLGAVSLVWPGQPRALIQGLNFDLPPGTVALIRGRNGSGKTSLIRMLAGTLMPSHGQVLVDGVDLRQISNGDWGRVLSYVPQESGFLEGRVRDGLAVTHQCDEGATARALTQVGLKPFFDGHPEGLDLKIEALGHPLSAGQRRRLALARALIVNGRLCLIDEPTDSLDQQGRDVVVTLMSDWVRAGRTLIIAASEADAVSGAHVTVDLDCPPGQQVTWHKEPPKSSNAVFEAPNVQTFPPSSQNEFAGVNRLAATLSLAALTIFAGLIWASGFELDVTSVGVGRVTTGSETVEVQNLEGGIVEDILVREGDAVGEGTELIRLETLANDATLAELRAQKTMLELQIGRWQAELDNAQAPYTTQAPERLIQDSLRLYKARRQRLASQIREQAEIVQQRKQQIAEFEARIRGQEKQEKSLDAQMTISQKMMDQNLIARIDHLKLVQQSEALSGEIEGNRAAKKQAISAQDEATARLSAIRAAAKEEARIRLETSHRELSQTLEQIRKINDSRHRQALRAPTAGTIKSIKIAAVGEVVQPGQTVVELTPEQDMPVIEVQFPVSEVGYLKLEQDVIVSLASADASRFAPIEAQIIHISADSFVDERTHSPYFKVRLMPSATEFNHGVDSYPLLPGVPILAQALIGSKTVLTYLIGPFLSSGRLALSER